MGSLSGIMDEVNSDAFDLSGISNDPVPSDMEKAYETFLAELVFSTNDPRVDIIERFDLVTDIVWLNWLTAKINKSTDPEEKVGLRDLKDMILEVERTVKLSKQAEERAAVEEENIEKNRMEKAEEDATSGRTMSNTDILRKAGGIDRGGIDTVVDEKLKKEKSKENFLSSELTPEIRLSYEKLCKKVLPPYKSGDTVSTVVATYYDQFDAQFIKVINERVSNGDKDSSAVLEALAVEQSQRVEAATGHIQNVLSLGDPMKMEGAIVKLAREGDIDETFLLLLEANAQQALDAGANGPAQLMKRLGKRAMEEKDKQATSKEVKLVRKLLRTDDQAEREKILTDAFTPKESLIVPGTAENAEKAFDGEAMDEENKPMPDVPPPDFINACKAVLLNFGNISSDDDKGDLATRIKQIASEAEVVATTIYGQGMTARDQQERAWKEQTTSIFDLETLEIDAERRGETAPWANADNDDTIPGFDNEGKMKIGGT